MTAPRVMAGQPHARSVLARLGRGDGAILCYHGLTSLAHVSYGMVNVPALDFERAVEMFERVGRIVPLSEMVERYLGGLPTRGLFALTMDDAYRSVRDLVHDFISKHRVPVALFPTLHGCEQGRPFWWDRVEDLFACVGEERWRRFEDAIGLPREYREGQPREFGPLRPLRQWVLAQWAGRWPDELEEPLAKLEAAAGFQTTQRPMTFAELDEVAALPTVEIGVHTVTHPVLPLLSQTDQLREIGACAEVLRGRYRSFLPILAVPFGLFDQNTERLAKRSGMQTVLTLGGELEERYRPGFGVPRICVGRSTGCLRLLWRLSRPYRILVDLAHRGHNGFPRLPSAVS